MKTSPKKKISILAMIFGAVLLLGAVIALQASPADETTLNVRHCNVESASATSGNFVGACTASNINLNDGTVQTATVNGNNLYMGMNMTVYNMSYTNCSEITNVKICYEWWSSSANIVTCSVKVDANAGASYSTASSTCPGTTANPGVICTDITALETWSCGSFFGSTGTKALASLEVRSTTGGTKTLSVDAFYYNVTFAQDNTKPSINITYPLNTTYTEYPVQLNTTISDTNLASCWWSNDSGKINQSFVCGANVSFMNATINSNKWIVYANDTFGNENSSSVAFFVNLAPNITSINTPSKIYGGNTITVNTTGVNDPNNETLYFYCSENTTAPTASATFCTGGNTTAPLDYNLTCTYPTYFVNETRTVYCRVYDGFSYSQTVNTTYNVTNVTFSTSITSVEYDSVPSYFDTNNNGRTDILVLGEASMLCRWSSSDLVYSSMTNDCSISGSTANCSVNDVLTQGLHTRYVSCKSSLGNEQTAANNLDINFYLDYTAPTTSDNSVSTIQLAPYIVTITELDNVDSDPTSYYCTSSTEGCSSTLSIDNGGTITYTSSNRGPNYLRYYSVDDAGNSQVVVNKTININRLPVFSSAADNAAIIKGGTTVTITTNSYDLDSSQNLYLYVCNSSRITSSGCSDSTYCTGISLNNASCGFASESDSTIHNWYAFIYDSLNEIAATNFSGSYITDSTQPIITIVSPTNTTYPQNSVTFSIFVDEALSSAFYSINGGANVSMSNSSVFDYASTNLSIANGNYNVLFYANDSYDNLANSSLIYFTVDNTALDTLAPVITINSPANNTYYLSADISINISSNENLSWVGYSLNNGAIGLLHNYSMLNWNKTITFTEGEYNLTIYANDTASAKNQAIKYLKIYVDLNNPLVPDFSCTDKNDSQDVICSANVSDSYGLDYAIIGYNATGSWLNSSQIDLTGNSSSLTYTIGSGNTTPPGFTAQIFLYDSAGRINQTKTDNIIIYDDAAPKIYNITYYPNSTAELDPGVRVYINATIVEDYSIGDVLLMYKNATASEWSSVNMTNATAATAGTSIVYNASLTFNQETWYFKINATDSAGNNNISANYSFIVANETSFWNGTTITSTKSFTASELSANKTLGFVHLNNTGDSSLDFEVHIDSSISSRFNINYTNDDNATYTVGSGGNISLILLINSTDLPVAIYYYNITVSSAAGTTIFERQLNIQTSSGPYLVTTIDDYSSSVTRGQTGILFSASVTNLGTQEATDVYLNWTLPSSFTLTSGSLSRSLGTLPIGVSGSNSIMISVSNSASENSVNVVATGLSSNANSSIKSKSITISDPVVVTQTTVVTTGGGGGGGSGGGGGGGGITYSQVFEVVRGRTKTFEVEITNKNYNLNLNNLKIALGGYPLQYIKIEPAVIDSIAPRQTQKFKITIDSPTYSDFEKLSLNATITGDYVSADGAKTAYTEKRNFLLVVGEVSKSQSLSILAEAEKIIDSMKNKGYNLEQVQALIKEAYARQNDFEYNSALNIANQIVELGKKAESTDNLIRRVAAAIKDPSDNYLLITGSFAADLDYSIPLRNLLTGNIIFGSQESRDMVDLAIVAFERGDYTLAEERAKSAMAMVINERKGNPLMFIYLYWNYILVFIFLFGFFSILGYRRFKQMSINERIKDLIKEDDNIRDLKKKNQENYFSGKISSSNYNLILDNYENKLAFITKMRIKLRSKRIKLLKPEKVLDNLEKERKQVEDEIKKIQTAFYKKGEVSKAEYESEFTELNERLAEIEDERVTAQLLKEKSKKRFSLFYYIKDYIFLKTKIDESEIKKEIEKIIDKHGKK